MSLFQIGKVLPDGKVRHIKAYLENNIDEISQKLRVFYRPEKRVDALLSLGDIDVRGLLLSANGEDRIRYIAAPLYGTDTATKTNILPELQITWRRSHTWPTIV